MYFITIKRMLEVCFSAHPNIQYRTIFLCLLNQNLILFSKRILADKGARIWK